MNNADKIIVLDFGSQYNQLISRRIRELGVYSELKSNKATAEEIKSMGNVKGIIFSGGPNSVYDQDSFRCDDALFDLNIPIFGICYGMQLIGHLNEGKIESSDIREYGRQEITVNNKSPLFDGLSEKQTVWMSHGDKLTKLPKGFTKVASSSSCEFAAIENKEKNIYGVQFHPEVQNSEHGIDMIRNFVFKIAKADPNWTMKNYIDLAIIKIKEEVKDKKVLLGLSGGVDSSVAAVLIHKAIGDNLTCMLVDHGLLRKNEADQVMALFDSTFNITVVKVDAKNRFF